MRSLMFLLVLVLLVTSSAPDAINAAQSKCCVGFTNVKVPVKLVKSFFWTTSSCPIRAIVFQMFSGREICVDPQAAWVNGHVAKVDKRTTSAATTTTTKTATSAATTASTAKTVDKCCVGFINVKVPVKLLKSFYWTSSSCPIRAIVFQMISGREFCVDPEAAWGNCHVDKVDKRTTV